MNIKVVNPTPINAIQVADAVTTIKRAAKDCKGPRNPEGETFVAFDPVTATVFNGKTVRIEQVGKGASLVDTEGKFWDISDITSLDSIIEIGRRINA